jgi:hypothetical protein
MTVCLDADCVIYLVDRVPDRVPGTAYTTVKGQMSYV